MTDDDVDIEYSPLCGEITRDGLTVRLQIYRIAGSSDGWSLEVIDYEEASTVWNDLFATDRDAYAEFSKCLTQNETSKIKVLQTRKSRGSISSDFGK
jgi:hypothetical protein